MLESLQLGLREAEVLNPEKSWNQRKNWTRTQALL